MSQPPLPFSRGALVLMDEWYPLTEQPKPADVGDSACCWQPKLARKRPRYGIFWRHWIGSAEWKKRWHPLTSSGDEDELLILVLLLGGEPVVAHRYMTKAVKPAEMVWRPAESPDGQPALSPVTLTRSLLPAAEEKSPLLDLRRHFLTEAIRSGQAHSRGEPYMPRPYNAQRGRPSFFVRAASAGLRAARSLWNRLGRAGEPR